MPLNATPHARAGGPSQAGFSLVEMAIVLLIVSLLLGGLLMPLTAQVEQRRAADTQRRLDQAREALIGFAIANGRLPCPATAASHGAEDPAGGGACTTHDGFLPAATLGLTQVDDSGYALDGWNSRVRYAVTAKADAGGNTFTAVGGMQGIVNGAHSAAPLYTLPDLTVCSSSIGITAASCGSTGSVSLVTHAPAVIYSLGKNWATGGGSGADEAANLNGDAVFVSHEPAAGTTPNGEFDDVVTWISPDILASRMFQAGTLAAP